MAITISFFEAMWKFETHVNMRIESPIGTTTVAARNSPWAKNWPPHLSPWKIFRVGRERCTILEFTFSQLFFTNSNCALIFLAKKKRVEEIDRLIRTKKKKNWPLVLLTRCWPETKKNVNSSYKQQKCFYCFLTFLGVPRKSWSTDQKSLL